MTTLDYPFIICSNCKKKKVSMEGGILCGQCSINTIFKKVVQEAKK